MTRLYDFNYSQEVIFSNVLVHDGKPTGWAWARVPDSGINTPAVVQRQKSERAGK